MQRHASRPSQDNTQAQTDRQQAFNMGVNQQSQNQITKILHVVTTSVSKVLLCLIPVTQAFVGLHATATASCLAHLHNRHLSAMC